MNYHQTKERLKANPKKWLVTGVAGFIGSNLLEELLRLNQHVIGLDNFATGHQRNLDEVRQGVTAEQWSRFFFVDGDIRDPDVCRSVMAFRSPKKISAEKVDYVLHQAAIGSVPRSIDNPVFTNANNIDGFLNVLNAAKDAGVERFVYAASSSTYGDHPDLPKVEEKIGKPLSPYAVTKLVNELYADVFARTYGMSCIGLRYFNIFGRRQDPDGAYAAVIPKWIASMIKSEEVFINGDGKTSRDFCYVDNAVQANLLAATSANKNVENQVYNIAVGDSTTLLELFEAIRESLVYRQYRLSNFKPSFREFRIGDVRHSMADISKAHRDLGYEPTHKIREGLEEAMEWYIQHYSKS